MMGKINLNGVIYELTTKCNLQCKYCYNHWKKHTDCIEEVEKYNPKKALKRWVSMANTNSFTFTGGEPTIVFEELLDCLMYVKAKNKKVTLITNATLLTKVQLDLLIELKVDLFEITINSYNKVIHDTINGMNGSFEKSVSAIEYLISKKCKVVVPIVITKYNVENITKTLEYIYNLGVREIMINRYNIGGNGCNSYDQVLPEMGKLKEAFEKCNDFVESNNIVLYSLVCTPICVLNPDDYNNIKFSHCKCDDKNRYYTLSRNGDIRFCNHSPEVLGNIFDNKVKDILDNGKIDEWKGTEPEFCNKCIKKEVCQFGCRAASQQIGYGLTHEDPIVQIYEAKPII